jgi:hypothetical protein
MNAKRNPVSANSVLTFGALAAAAFIVWKLSQGAKTVVDAAGKVVTAVTPKSVVAAGTTVVLDSGVQIPWSAASAGALTPANLAWWSNTGPMMFDYNGVRYQLTSDTPDETNTYYALTVQ